MGPREAAWVDKTWWKLVVRGMGRRTAQDAAQLSDLSSGLNGDFIS